MTDPKRIFSAKSGVLIVEAVVASFLMLFAFIAATQLFDASLRWESGSANDRLAAVVAERKMEELRGWIDTQCLTTSFDSLDWAGQEVVHVDYPEAPGFFVTVETDLPTYTQPRAETGRAPIVPGLHSPSSQLFAAAPAGQNAQKHPLWLTYPYTRNLDSSLRRVQVTVEYGSDDSRQFRLVSLLGDSIAPPDATSPADFPTTPVVVTGPSSLSPGDTGTYQVEVQLSNGQPIEDVTALWSVAPISTGAAALRPLDAQGRQVEVTRSALTPSGSSLRLAVKVRYRGKEIVGYSEVISMP